MDNRNKNHESGNGFLFGVVLGSIATLLFTTKRGREILKEITDKGIGKISELEKRLKEVEALKDEGESDYILPEARPVQTDEADLNKFVSAPSSEVSSVDQLDAEEQAKLAKIEEKMEKTASVKKNASTPKTHREVKRYFRKKS